MFASQVMLLRGDVCFASDVASSDVCFASDVASSDDAEQ